MTFLENIDATPVFMILSWWYMRRNFLSNLTQNVETATNKHMMFLLLLSNILQMYYYFMVLSILTVLLLYLFKFLLLEQIAQMLDGRYPFSIEEVLRNKVLKLFSEKSHMIFNLIVFLIIIVFTYVLVMFVFDDETDESTKENQMKLSIDMILYIYVLAYIIWVSSLIFT